MIALAISSSVIGAGMFAWKAEATTSTAAATLGATAKNYSPVQKAAWVPDGGATALQGPLDMRSIPVLVSALLGTVPLTHRLFEAAPSRGRPRPI